MSHTVKVPITICLNCTTHHVLLTQPLEAVVWVPAAGMVVLNTHDQLNPLKSSATPHFTTPVKIRLHNC